MTKSPTTPRKTTLRKCSLIFYVRWFGLGATLLWLLAVLMLVAVRSVNPPTTAVQIERRLQGWIHNTPYHERYRFVRLNQISPDLQHAVIAAEDARFYQHHGFDWHAIQLAAEGDMEGGRLRGGVGVPFLLPNLGPKYRPGTVSTTRRDSAGSPEATA